jgi:hypothetical protein
MNIDTEKNTLPKLLNEKELCAYLGKSIAWACQRRRENVSKAPV